MTWTCTTFCITIGNYWNLISRVQLNNFSELMFTDFSKGYYVSYMCFLLKCYALFYISIVALPSVGFLSVEYCKIWLYIKRRYEESVYLMIRNCDTMWVFAWFSISHDENCCHGHAYIRISLDLYMGHGSIKYMSLLVSIPIFFTVNYLCYYICDFSRVRIDVIRDWMVVYPVFCTLWIDMRYLYSSLRTRIYRWLSAVSPVR